MRMKVYLLNSDRYVKFVARQNNIILVSIYQGYKIQVFEDKIFYRFLNPELNRKKSKLNV